MSMRYTAPSEFGWLRIVLLEPGSDSQFSRYRLHATVDLTKSVPTVEHFNADEVRQWASDQSQGTSPDQLVDSIIAAMEKEMLVVLREKVLDACIADLIRAAIGERLEHYPPVAQVLKEILAERNWLPLSVVTSSQGSNVPVESTVGLRAERSADRPMLSRFMDSVLDPHRAGPRLRDELVERLHAAQAR